MLPLTTGLGLAAERIDSRYAVNSPTCTVHTCMYTACPPFIDGVYYACSHHAEGRGLARLCSGAYARHRMPAAPHAYTLHACVRAVVCVVCVLLLLQPSPSAVTSRAHVPAGGHGVYVTHIVTHIVKGPLHGGAIHLIMFVCMRACVCMARSFGP